MDQSSGSASTDLPVTLRPAAESDRLYILNSWVKSYGDSPWAQSMPKSVYRDGHSRLVEALYPRCRVLVACDPEVRDTILGWCATEGDTVHYCYTRAAVRRRGIAKKLLAPYITKRANYSHPANWLKLPSIWTWSPYTLHDKRQAS